MQWENHTKDNGATELHRLGTRLKALREAQGLSYDDVADVTHVRPHIIQAIENGTIEEVAPSVYARGFIKTYCEYLMASDLWRKYSLGIPSQDEPGEVGSDLPEDPVEIQHPTPMFRRSSIIWVYIILVVAVVGAAYLLWNQHREQGTAENAFSLRFPESSGDSAPALFLSADITAASGDNALSADILSADPPISIPAPQSPGGTTSGDGWSVAPGDISWMDGMSVSARMPFDLPQLIDRILLIEITGSNNKLIVEQGGKVVTRRTLGIGGRRSYEVTNDTKVTISSGNSARVMWFGKRYDSVGADNRSITLVFHPDSSVTLVSGKSLHFGAGASSGDG